MSEKKIYKKEDLVVHTYYGIGKITGVQTRKAADGKLKFFNIKLMKKSGWQKRYRVKEKYIRSIATQDEIKKALQIIQDAGELKTKKANLVRKHYINELEKGTIFSKARIIRDLNQLKVDGNIDKWAKRRLKKINDQFVTEWSIAVNEDKEKIKNKFDKLLKNGNERVKAGKK